MMSYMVFCYPNEVVIVEIFRELCMREFYSRLEQGFIVSNSHRSKRFFSLIFDLIREIESCLCLGLTNVISQCP